MKMMTDEEIDDMEWRPLTAEEQAVMNQIRNPPKNLVRIPLRIDRGVLQMIVEERGANSRSQAIEVLCKNMLKLDRYYIRPGSKELQKDVVKALCRKLK